jgi:hypothetical protein
MIFAFQKRTLILLVLLFFACPPSQALAQSSDGGIAPHGKLQLKTNPLQYGLLRFNLSAELGLAGRMALDLKVEAFPSFYREPTRLYNLTQLYGAGLGGHVLLRIYDANRKWWLAPGLSFKTWKYKNKEDAPGTFSGSGSYPCYTQSATAIVPGLKVLGGVQVRSHSKPLLMEFYSGLGAKINFQETTVHTSGSLGNGCTVYQYPDGGLVDNERLIAPTIFLGLNLGFDLMRARE